MNLIFPCLASQTCLLTVGCLAIPCIFVVMFECRSIIILMHLDGYMLIIADRCHICFACHFQTVHPILVIFISISTEIISSFQQHTWFGKFMPWSFFPFLSTHMHYISCLAYHAMYCSVVSGSSSPTCLLIVVPAMIGICHITSYVYMSAIIFSVPFWLMFSKVLLLYAISKFMTCLCLPW